jgi:hypothetical protein
MDLSVLIPPLSSNQEAYEKIFRWFSQPSVAFGYDTSTGNCVYRGNNWRGSNIRCAVGCLIPDELYVEPKDEYDEDGSSGMENVTADAAIQKSAELERFFANVDSGFLLECQRAHDSEAAKNNPSIERFLLALNKVAAEKHLTLIAS